MKTFILIKGGKEDYVKYGGYIMAGAESVPDCIKDGWQPVFEYDSMTYNVNGSVWQQYKEACQKGWAHLTHAFKGESLEQLKERHKVVQALIQEKYKEHLESIPND